MANLLALSPIVVLLVGALAMLPSRSYARLRSFTPPVAILAAVILVLVNARQAENTPFLFPGSASAPDLDLTFNFNAGALFFSVVALMGLFALGMIEKVNAERRVGTGALVTLAGMVGFFCAANWPTLAAAWLLADFGLLLWRLSDSNGSDRPAPWRALVLSQFGAFVFLGAGVLVLNSGSSLRFEDAVLEGLSADLVFIAAWIRIGLYPFQSQAKPNGDRPARFERTFAAGLLGFFLLIRALMMMRGEFAFASVLYAFALLCVAATALLVLAKTGPGQSLAAASRAIGAPLLLIPFLAAVEARPALAVWYGLGLFNFVVIATGASLLMASTPRQPWRQVLWGTAILAAAGFPLTPGFFGRVGLYAAAMSSGDTLLIVAIIAATTLALIPLWQSFVSRRSEEERNPTLFEYAGLAALLLPLLIQGLAPFTVTSFFGRQVEDASAFAYDALFHAPNVLSPVLLLGAVILPLPLAFFLARVWGQPISRVGNPPAVVARVLDISSVGRAIVLALDSLGMTARQVSALIEQHPIGWILFAAIWVALWLLRGQG